MYQGKVSAFRRMYAILVFQGRCKRNNQSNAPSRHSGKRRESSQSKITARLL